MLETGEMIYAVAGLAAGIILTAAFFFVKIMKMERRNAELTMQVKMGGEALERAGASLDMRFKTTAQEALTQTSAQFLQMAEAKLASATKDSAHDLEKRQKAIENLVDPVNKALTQMDEKIQQLEKARVGAYGELQAHLKTMTEDQIRLRRETGTLVQALRSPSTRGQWGEMQLKRCLEMAGMKPGIHYQEQVSADNGQRPDVIVKMTEGKTIVIDSKVSLIGYLDALKEDISETDYDEALNRHAQQIRTHIRTLSSKAYWESFNTPELVIMFLPGESYFYAALEKDPALMEDAMSAKVFLATPTNLVSMLKAIMYGWKQEKLAENAREVSALGNDLYKSIKVFTNHIQKLGRNLGTAVDAYNDAMGSLDRNILSKARKFEDLHVSPQGEVLDSPDHIDHAIRRLSAPEASDAGAEASADEGTAPTKRRA